MQRIPGRIPLTKRLLDFLLRRAHPTSVSGTEGKHYSIVTFDWPSGHKVVKHLSEAQVRKAIYRLKGSGYILAARNQSGKTIITLTEKALAYARGRLTSRAPRQHWDGWWRLVMFDVPEDARDLRDHLRYALHTLGFRMLQESVWIHPHDVFDELEKLVPDIKRHQWIRLLEARTIAGGATTQLRKAFAV